MKSYLEGICKVIIYHNVENSFTVAKIEVTECKDELSENCDKYLIITGFFPKIEVNNKVRVTGTYKNHPKYGYQLEVKTIEKIFDNSKEGLIDYFQGDLFFGIGKATATLMVETLGTNLIDEILDNKDILKKVPKLSIVKQEMIYRVLTENKGIQKTLVKLYEWGLTPRLAMKIIKKYDNDSIERILDNPYRLIDDVDGIGFARADNIAFNIGFEKNSPLRIKALIVHVVNLVYQKYGDTYLTYRQLKENIFKYLDVKIDEEDNLLKENLNALVDENKIIIENDIIYQPYIYYSEINIAKKLIEIHDERRSIYSNKQLTKALLHVSQNLDIDYTPLQTKAIEKALNKNFMILTGGPGTGKTTVIKGIIDSYKFLEGLDNDNPKIEYLKLCAPTGRAAKRMSITSGHKAETIHKMLGYDYEGKFKYSKDNLLEANFVIVDEFSMVDSLLMNQLIQSLRRGTKLIIVGDEDQLPSVGCGQVLKDIIDSDLFTLIRLDKIHRQAEHSNIIKLAHEIKDGNIEDNIYDFHDLKFIKSDEKSINEKILFVIEESVKRGYDLKRDIQVLIPMYKGSNGIDNINENIQKNFNPFFSGMKEIENGDRVFRQYDKVMQLVNQADDNIMNGDQGEITQIINDEIFVQFDFNVVKYAKSDLINIKHAYAISIHKAQGSEYPIVIMPIIGSYSYMLRRNLIYTGITRAKKELILIGDFNTFKRGVSQNTLIRQTTLKNRLLNQNNNNTLKILDPRIPFDTLGEINMENITPYNFLEDE